MIGQIFYIKGMVCHRCVATVINELEKLGLQSPNVVLGKVSFTSSIEAQAEFNLIKQLSMHGFSVLEDKRVQIVNKVKCIVTKVYSGEYDFPDNFRFSGFLADELGKDFQTISEIFISKEKKSIEQHMIHFRINKVKEFLVYTNLTLSDIAFKLNYSSVAHLSSQFKRETGLTPSYFKEIKREKAAAVFSVN